MKRAPLLVLAVGNPSRGDDALGPALLERLRAAGVGAASDVELLTDFQLQVEHALDLDGRRAVLFVDAARPGAMRGVCIEPIYADACLPPASHALRAQAVLHVAMQLADHAPPAWQLAMEGEHFALGEGLSPMAERHLACAVDMVLSWLQTINEGPIMIYKFKSQAAADVIMLQLNGDQMLAIVGKEPSAQGIITVAQIPAAIAALEAAIVTHEAAQARRAEQPQMEVDVEGDSVRLRDRAAPFIELLRTSAQAGKDVVWGV